MTMPVSPSSPLGAYNGSNANISTLAGNAGENKGRLAQAGSPGNYVVPVAPLPLTDAIRNKLRNLGITPPVEQTNILGPGGSAELNITDSGKVLSKINELNKISRWTRSPQMTASLYEQLHGLYSDQLLQAGMSINAMTAARSQLTALYGAGQVSAAGYQLSLARLNVEISKIRAVVDTSAGEVALLSYQNAGTSVRTRIKSLDVNLKGLYTNISAAQKQIGMELKTVDQSVAQLRANGNNEIALSNRKLNGSIKKVLDGANRAIETNMRQGFAVPDKNGIIPVPALIGDVVLTSAQRTQMGQFYIPLRKLDLKTIESLNPQVVGQPRLNVDGLGSDALRQKTKLAELVKQYGSIEAVAKHLGFKSVKQMETLRSIVISKNFDPSKLNEKFETAKNYRSSLAGGVGRISAESLKKLKPIDATAQLKIIGHEIGLKVGVPEWFKAYAKKVSIDVDTLVVEAWGQYYAGKIEAMADYLSLSLMNPLQLKNLALKLVSGGTVATVPNIWPGTQVRLERVAINLRQMQLAQVTAATSFQALNNAVRSYDTAMKGVGVSVENAELALKTTQKQINNIERNYGAAKLNSFGEAISVDGLKALRLQYQTAKLSLQRTEYSQKIAYSLAVDRLKLTQAIGTQASVTDASTKVVEDMGMWNARELSRAVISGIADVDGGKIYKTPEGLVIRPAVLTRFWKLNRSGPTASELKQASNQTLVQFQNEFSVSGKHISNRTNQGLAGIGAFNGNLSAYQTRMVIQPKQGPVTTFKIPNAPTSLELKPDKNAKIPPPLATSPQLQENVDGRRGEARKPFINPNFPPDRSVDKAAPSSSTVKPERQLPPRDTVDREMELSYLSGTGRLFLAPLVDDPAQRAQLWTDHGILVKRVGGEDSMTYDLYALPANTPSPGRSGSNAVASQATFYKRVYDPMYPPGLIPVQKYTPTR